MTDYGKNPALSTVFVDRRATSRRLRTAKIRIDDGPDKGKAIDIGKLKVYVGRSAVNDLTVNDKAISGTHFEISAAEEGYLLRDLGSTNGVTYQGLRIKEAFLKPGCKFKAGNSTFVFQPSEDMVDLPLSEQDRYSDLLGRSVNMRSVFATLEKVSPSNLTVLIDGETGTGKERVAQAIHSTSRRKKGNFVVLDCSAIPRDLMESTVFGHEKGAFTGAISQHKGSFEQADGGTIFMDEIGELPLDLQPKLLRVLENRELKRVGGDRTIRIDVRVVAATNRDLRQMVSEGTFREDLYFRLSVIQLSLPPLRDRIDDVALLANHFLEDFTRKHPSGRRMQLTSESMDVLTRHGWPGNVRELKNVMERAYNLGDGPDIIPSDLHMTNSLVSRTPANMGSLRRESSDSSSTSIEVDLTECYKDAKQRILDQFERDYMSRLIKEHNGNISQAARTAGLTRYHLRELLKKHSLIDKS